MRAIACDDGLRTPAASATPAQSGTGRVSRTAARGTRCRRPSAAWPGGRARPGRASRAGRHRSCRRSAQSTWHGAMELRGDAPVTGGRVVHRVVESAWATHGGRRRPVARTARGSCGRRNPTNGEHRGEGRHVGTPAAASRPRPIAELDDAAGAAALGRPAGSPGPATPRARTPTACSPRSTASALGQSGRPGATKPTPAIQALNGVGGVWGKAAVMRATPTTGCSCCHRSRTSW